MRVKTTAFWNVTPCSVVDGYQHFGAICCVVLQDRRWIGQVDTTLHNTWMRQDSLDRTVTLLGADDPGLESREGQKSFTSPYRPDRLCDPPNVLIKWYRLSFPRVKRPCREVNHSPPTSAEFKNECSYTSTPPIYLHGVDRDAFTFTYTTHDVTSFKMAILMTQLRMH
jgi:hypothetical protein